MINPAEGRTKDGKFAKGYSGHPRASLRVLPDGRTLAQIARESTEEAVHLLTCVMRGVDPQTGEPRDYDMKDRIKAVEHILNRGWGKAVSNVVIEAPEEKDIAELSRIELAKIVQRGTALIEAEPEVVDD